MEKLKYRRVKELTPELAEQYCQKFTICRFLATPDHIFVTPVDQAEHDDMYEEIGKAELIDGGFIAFAQNIVMLNEISNFLDATKILSRAQQLSNRDNTASRIQTMLPNKSVRTE